jgi:hypothetical protein
MGGYTPLALAKYKSADARTISWLENYVQSGGLQTSIANV